MLRGYWLILVAVAIAMTAAVVIAVVLRISPCSDLSREYWDYQCYAEPIAKVLTLWVFGLILLGPLPVVMYEYGKVKFGARSTLRAWIHCVAGSLASNFIALSVLGGTIDAGQRFRLFSLFSGDAGFGLIALGVWAALSLGFTAIVSPIVFYATRSASES